jgi:hypothetical protein
MNEQTEREGDQANSLRKVVRVNAPPGGGVAGVHRADEQLVAAR